MPIDKTFEPASVEARIHDKWERAQAFKANPDPSKQPFSIVIPPPNVTGSLHMGHALNNTLQDILCRFERMRGKDVLWQVGTDHAGIATQMVVERKLAEKGENRRDLGREEFLKRVWDWKEESGGTIIAQLKRLGASCDWSRERFTMDEGLSKAVTKVFVQLYNEGLIYRDKRLVNWDPHFQTAISDLEVVQVEKRGSFKWERASRAKVDTGFANNEMHKNEDKDAEGNAVAFDASALEKILKKDPHGHMYYINYPLEDAIYDPDKPETFITVATTRPETLLGDVAVAVHPTNEKYKHLIGKNVVLPLVGRLIPIVGDDYADPEKGTGAVKITPAHDFNDFEVGKRHKLRARKILTGIGTIYIDIGGHKNSDFDDYFASLEEKRKTWMARTSLAMTQAVHAQEPQPVMPVLDTGIHDLNSVDGSQDVDTRVKPAHDGSGSRSRDLMELNILDRFIARFKVVEWLFSEGLLIKIEPTTHTVPHGDRSGVTVEPFLTDQWYVNVKPLAEKAMAAVRSGNTKFVPQNWEKTYFQWLENIEPWCISRQLWWGHQVPVWYGPDLKEFVYPTEEEAIKAAKQHYGHDIFIKFSSTMTQSEAKEYVFEIQSQRRAVENKEKNTPLSLRRDEDVLDTWFSSALWPFSTMGWPENTDELKRYYPTSVLITGFDIIFFWVARMMMMGIHFMDGEVPFKDVYIHALVRDASGAKMSKSKGNVVDPLQLIDQYGADALRFTLAAMAAQGRDIKLSLQRVEGYRNFATKLWNASRFAEMNGCARVHTFDPSQVKETLNQWALHECAVAIKDITAALEAYRFNDAANRAYRFVWNVFCDWYVELAKPTLQGTQAFSSEVGTGSREENASKNDSSAKEETRATIDYLIDQICKLLHPFMPFLTEELWNIRGCGGKPDTLLTLSSWPDLSHLENPEAEAEIGWCVELINEIRSARSETNVPAAAFIPLVLIKAPNEFQARATRWGDLLKRLARLSDITFSDTPPAQSMQLIVRGVSVALPLAGVIDLTAERARLDKEQLKATSEIEKIEAKLSNEEFLKRAPEEVVEEQRERLEELNNRKNQLQEAMARLQNSR
jgi:valyl-tRNA synthetase